MKKLLSVLTLISVTLMLSNCGIQSIPMAKNEVEAGLAEVTNQYKRRSDLIPNLVKVVKGYAKQEKDTLTAVVEARAQATQNTIDPSKATAAQIQKFQQVQGQLGQALGRLMMISERYPDLKSNQNFLDLQAQLEGTENRITIARQRYIQTIKGFNNLVTVFPTSIMNNLMFHYEKMPQWDVKEGENVEATPEIDL